jgi:hypothetical protein
LHGDRHRRKVREHDRFQRVVCRRGLQPAAR